MSTGCLLLKRHRLAHDGYATFICFSKLLPFGGPYEGDPGPQDSLLNPPLLNKLYEFCYILPRTGGKQNKYEWYCFIITTVWGTNQSDQGDVLKAQCQNEPIIASNGEPTSRS